MCRDHPPGWVVLSRKLPPSRNPVISKKNPKEWHHGSKTIKCIIFNSLSTCSATSAFLLQRSVLRRFRKRQHMLRAHTTKLLFWIAEKILFCPCDSVYEARSHLNPLWPGLYDFVCKDIIFQKWQITLKLQGLLSADMI